jgi:hypothetical protein
VIISAGGDLIARQQQRWRRVHNHTIEQHTQRAATDAKLRAALISARKVCLLLCFGFGFVFSFAF